MSVIGKAALLTMAVSTLLGVHDETAHASGGPFTTAQDGEQNLDCGNSHELVSVNVLRTIRRERTCTRPGSRDADASAVGGTALGPQFTTAQSGKQNLHCGNSADVMTVNVLSTVEEETTCQIVDDSQDLPGRARASHTRSVEEPGSVGASAVGGTALGPQFTTAQSGKQNLDCGNSADVLTVNALGTVSKRTTCEAVDGSSSHGPGVHRRGQATAMNGTAAGPQSATAQTGRQNLHCGSDSDLVVLTVPEPNEPTPGGLDKSADCRAVDRSTTRH
ncbi:hypothetical protein [Streptomyces sp. TRM68367]|uniref:hypothetical protein n=1 Tax=Streptomyces sp. TRM68367 TaxID=2758415 RepID=UPI00165A9CA6|nr:hypothetical protein [Streptomyces sp. TRM68367]MBC9731247.1 hypothetical protein [Streptomyces sp. TRM68367]